MKSEAPVQVRVPVAAHTNGAARAADWPKPERRGNIPVDHPDPDASSDRHRLFGLRAQGATLFVLLVIVVGGLLANISVASRASDDTSREQTALLTWRYDAAQVDSYGSTLANGLYQWNNLLAAGDAPGARAQMTAAQSQIAKIQSLLTEISNLSLPPDAMGIEATYRDASLAFTSFASKFLAAGVHPDADLQIEVGAANAIRVAARAPVEPFIDQEVSDNQSIDDSRRASVYQLIDFGGAVALVLLLLLAFIVFRLILTPVVRLADAATTLAAGRPAMIKRTARKDEIGQLTRALAAWQQNSVAGLNDVSSRAASAALTLSTVAEQLASATLEQTSAASATSASMDELARSSGSIADTIDGVAVQASEVSSNLKQAQTDLRASGDRTLALAGRINEIESILTVLNDIADQTNLLALNAAIEAARAGDAGRGFAVVADEVRRLAERSKAAAAQIAKLVEGVQGQSSETVMALEKGVKQMERGLGMMLAMAEVSSQVRLATQQQRSSTEQVVRAIEHIAESSRSVAATSQEIASAAAMQSDLAGELENMSSNTAADSSPRPTGQARLVGKKLGEVAELVPRPRD